MLTESTVQWEAVYLPGWKALDVADGVVYVIFMVNPHWN
jgi:hypothetical protein